MKPNQWFVVWAAWMFSVFNIYVWMINEKLWLAFIWKWDIFVTVMLAPVLVWAWRSK